MTTKLKTKLTAIAISGTTLVVLFVPSIAEAGFRFP